MGSATRRAVIGEHMQPVTALADEVWCAVDDLMSAPTARLYRGLVSDSSTHVLVTHLLLSRTARRSKRARAGGAAVRA